MPTEQLIGQFGPVIFLIWGFYYVLPNLVNQVMNVIDKNAQAKADVARAPYEALNTVLTDRSRNDLIAIQLIGISASQERIEAAIIRVENTLKHISDKLEEFIQFHKEKK